ncbi:MAG TPA: hypothetical protein VIQ22_06210, partial [Gammaproteobacteria bacterium]
VPKTISRRLAANAVPCASRHFRPFRQLARQKAASLKHAFTSPEMTVMLGCTPREGDPQGGAEGGFLFGYFLLAAQEKVTCARGSPPPHQINYREAT